MQAGYAKFETFPIWNLPLKHPVNLAYEAATADLNDVNMIDPFHLEAYGVTTVNYNRDVEIFPVLSAMFEQIMGESPYKSPTDMGVNMAGNCIIDDEVCREASLTRDRPPLLQMYVRPESQRRGQAGPLYKLELLMNQAGIAPGRPRGGENSCRLFRRPSTVPRRLPLSWPTAASSPAKPARCWARRSPRPC